MPSREPSPGGEFETTAGGEFHAIIDKSAARADSLYAAVAVRSPHKYEEGEYLVIRPLAPTDTSHRLVIELVGGSVKRFRVGRSPQVEYVEGCS
jgi:hypothetical protein